MKLGSRPVFSKLERDRFPEPGEVEDALEEHLGEALASASG